MAACREELYSEFPFEANCSGTTGAWRGAAFRATYFWKSYQYSAIDERLQQVKAYAPKRAPEWGGNENGNPSFYPLPLGKLEFSTRCG